jgi:hypothetical protein
MAAATPVPAAIAVAVAIEASVLTDSEVGLLAFGGLSLGTWQCGANQRAVHGPFVLDGWILGFDGDVGLGHNGDGFSSGRGGGRWLDERFVHWAFDDFVDDRRIGRSDGRRRERGRVGSACGQHAAGLLPP